MECSALGGESDLVSGPETVSTYCAPLVQPVRPQVGGKTSFVRVSVLTVFEIGIGG
jgi:hypothetical protein